MKRQPVVVLVTNGSAILPQKDLYIENWFSSRSFPLLSKSHRTFQNTTNINTMKNHSYCGRSEVYFETWHEMNWSTTNYWPNVVVPTQEALCSNIVTPF